MSNKEQVSQFWTIVDTSPDKPYEVETHSANELGERVLEILDKPEYARTFFLGFDLKRAPTNKWYVIEVNGRNTGLKGLEQVDPYFSVEQFADSARREYGMVTTKHANLLIDAFIKFGSERIKPQEVVLEEDKEAWVDKMAKAVTNTITFNEEGFEQAIEDKTNHKHLLPPEFTVPFIILDGSETVQYLKSWSKDVSLIGGGDFSEDLVVLKSPLGSQGKAVHVYRLKRLPQVKLPTGYIFEPFVISEPIISTADGFEHDACMRFGILANVNEEGLVDFRDAGGYWRVSPRPVNSTRSRLKNRYTANLSRGAFAQAANALELQMARDIVEKSTIHMFSRFYGRNFTKKE